MKQIKDNINITNYIVCVFFFALFFACGTTDETVEVPILGDSGEHTTEAVVYADIDFSKWKVTLPIDQDGNGNPDEYQPSQLVNFGYQTLNEVKPFMYDDTTDASIVFYTYPDISTSNSSYSRTELRELINPNNSRENWSLGDGGVMKGRLKISEISQNTQSSNTYHNVIVMQIHGIISQEDMDSHGFSSNNGPPLLKMYWKDGYLWAHKKSLVNESTQGDDLLDVSSNTWYDIKHNFGYVGFEPFDFMIKATEGRLELQLNNDEPFIYQDVSLEKWPFENYFKAGNYLVSTDANAFAYIKYYNLSVTH
jgi:hypothetical protein